MPPGIPKLAMKDLAWWLRDQLATALPEGTTVAAIARDRIANYTGEPTPRRARERS